MRRRGLCLWVHDFPGFDGRSQILNSNSYLGKKIARRKLKKKERTLAIMGSANIKTSHFSSSEEAIHENINSFCVDLFFLWRFIFLLKNNLSSSSGIMYYFISFCFSLKSSLNTFTYERRRPVKYFSLIKNFK